MISIIIPVFNKEKYIKRCLESIKNQSFGNFECIIIDDGSTDNSAKICEHFVSIDSRFKYFYQENQGVSSARNKGIKISMKKYICFIDADDYIGINYLHHLYEATINVEDNNSLIISVPGSSDNYKESKCLKISELLDNFNEYYNYKIYNPPWGKIFLNNGIIHFFNTEFQLGEDLIFILHYLCDSKDMKVKFINNSEYYYSENVNSSLSSSITFDKLQQLSELMNYIYFYFNDQIEIQKIIKIQGNSLFNKIIVFYNENKSQNIININNLLSTIKRSSYIKNLSIRFKLLLLVSFVFKKLGIKVYLDILSVLDK